MSSTIQRNVAWALLFLTITSARVTIPSLRWPRSSSPNQQFEKFILDQRKLQTRVQQQVEELKQKAHDEFETLRKQQTELQEAWKKSLAERPLGIDDSLDAFKRFYNESLTIGPYKASTNLLPPQTKWRLPTFRFQNPFEGQLITGRFGRVREKDTPFSETIDQSLDSARLSLQQGADSVDRAVRATVDDLAKWQDDVMSNAKRLATSSQAAFQSTPKDRRAIRVESLTLETRLQQLNREGAVWADEQAKRLGAIIASTQEKLADLSNNKNLNDVKLTVECSAANDAALNNVLKLIDLSNKGTTRYRKAELICSSLKL